MIYELQSRPSIKAYRDDSIGMLTSFSYLTMLRTTSQVEEWFSYTEIIVEAEVQWHSNMKKLIPHVRLGLIECI